MADILQTTFSTISSSPQFCDFDSHLAEVCSEGPTDKVLAGLGAKPLQTCELCEKYLYVMTRS